MSVWGSRFRVWGVGFGAQVFGYRVWGLRHRIKRLRFRVWGLVLGLKVPVLGFRI